MSCDDANPYYHPEKLGLEQVAMIDYSDGNYCFDTRVVWKHTETGKFYTARDAGCSCPTPFEYYKRIEDLQDYSYEAIRREAQDEASRTRYEGELIIPFLNSLPQEG